MDKIIITTPEAPAPIGPYSQAVKAGGMMFLSGQIPLDTEGNIVGADAREQTMQIFRNIRAVLVSAGLDLPSVVKTTVYLKDMRDFADMNDVYGTFFREDPPARSCVQVAALPKDCLVEIDIIAVC